MRNLFETIFKCMLGSSQVDQHFMPFYNDCSSKIRFYRKKIKIKKSGQPHSTGLSGRLVCQANVLS